MYTSDQIDDMEERGEITWIQHTILYEKMQMGEYKLYPKFIQKLTNKEEKRTMSAVSRDWPQKGYRSYKKLILPHLW